MPYQSSYRAGVIIPHASHRLGMRLLLAMSLSIMPGCATPKQATTKSPLPPDLERQCTPAQIFSVGPDLDPVTRRLLDDTDSVKTVTPLDRSLSPQAQRLAEVLRLYPLLSKIERLQGEAGRQGEAADLRLLLANQDLTDRVLQVMVEVSEIVAELDCERVRSEELAVRLEEIENDRRNKRTVTAVMAEPIFHVLAATSLVFGMPVVAGGLEVVGNGIRLGFGLAADRVAQRERMSHSHNFMLEVWEGPEHPQYFPPSIWRFLSTSTKNGHGPTRREVIVTIWRGHLGTPGSATEKRRLELFFGRGGVYGVRDLRHRADMLGVLSAFINLIRHDINALFYETLGHLPESSPDQT